MSHRKPITINTQRNHEFDIEKELKDEKLSELTRFLWSEEYILYLKHHLDEILQVINKQIIVEQVFITKDS